MKKIFALAMSAALILSGCSSNAPTNPAVSGSSVSTASSSGEYNFTIGTSATKILQLDKPCNTRPTSLQSALMVESR